LPLETLGRNRHAVLGEGRLDRLLRLGAGGSDAQCSRPTDSADGDEHGHTGEAALTVNAGFAGPRVSVVAQVDKNSSCQRDEGQVMAAK
jgi:hypothetical protein